MIAIVMDIFTDVDIFKEIVDASTRGISVYLLLDESNFSHFFKMAEKQGCQVQRLRNMRVRTVKGQEYFSKSGAKFHGKMEQKFLLVDCKKAMYGTYSFMWSFEKANLSMVQIITGQLVESFDEEFRTLYARSSVPSSFDPELVRVNSRRALWDHDAYQHSQSSLASVSSQRNLLGRQDKIHSFDPNFLKARGRYGINDNDKFGNRIQLFNKTPLLPGFHMQNRIQQLQSNEEHWKRHSYAGEKPERTPYLMLNRAMNRTNKSSNAWKVPSDSLSIVSSLHGSHTDHHNAPQQSLADRFPQPKLNMVGRNSIVRRSFNGTDSHMRHLQQKMPTLERTTKSFLRNWRIESYLNDQSDFPADSNGSGVGERCEGSDAAENVKAHALYAHSRLRSSFVFKPTLPEQKEVNSCASSSNSTIIGSEHSETPKATPNHLPKIQDVTDDTETEPSPNVPLEVGVVKSQSPQLLEDKKPSFNPPVIREQPAYLNTAVSTNRPVEFLKNHRNEYILKRRSFPIFNQSKSALDNGDNKEESTYIYSTLNRNRIKPPLIITPPPEDALKISKSLHSVPGHLADDAKNLRTEPKGSCAAKSISVAALVEVSNDESSKDALPKKESKNSPNFLKKGSQKLRSLLNLTPDKKENLSKSKAPAFYRMCSSSDTLASEDEGNQKAKVSELKADCSPRKKRMSSSNSQGSLHRSKEDVTLSPTKSPRSPKLPKSPKSPKPPKSPKSPKSLKPPSEENLKRCPAVMPLENMLLEPAGDVSTPRFNTEQIQYQEAREVSTNKARALAHAPAGVLSQRANTQRANTVTAHPSSTKPKDELLRSRLSERRVYSRFEPFCNMESSAQQQGGVQSRGSTPKSSTHVSETSSKASGNNYSRSNQVATYNPRLYHPLHPNENKFRGFMQKFGNFIYKNK
ncbi:PREDICTED: protein FAM83B, partial [Gekko japonicus]|uniref:Protein FAM83B n=1 Tax=Gekko japonicus TaxID=146911 RepID=A0ABM1KJ82_GEKJA